MSKYLLLVTTVFLTLNVYSGTEDQEACETALEAMQKYDSEGWKKTRGGMNCKYNEKPASFWNCVEADLKKGGTVYTSPGICENKK